MFTGLIEEIGAVVKVERRGDFQRTVVGASAGFLDSLRPGDSVNIDGACQTVVACGREGFAFESVAETLRRTTLGRLRRGTPVNLERSLRAGDRLGGHFVAGHVDGVGRVADRSDGAAETIFRFEVPGGLEKYIAEKGSVAVDGISLTVVHVVGRRFTVAIIPHTLKATTLSLRRPADPVNVEVDLIARYVERLMGYRGGAGEGLSEESKGFLTRIGGG